jgi:hypothetical protein
LERDTTGSLTRKYKHSRGMGYIPNQNQLLNWAFLYLHLPPYLIYDNCNSVYKTLKCQAKEAPIMIKKESNVWQIPSLVFNQRKFIFVSVLEMNYM